MKCCYAIVIAIVSIPYKTASQQSKTTNDRTTFETYQMEGFQQKEYYGFFVLFAWRPLLRVSFRIPSSRRPLPERPPGRDSHPTTPTRRWLLRQFRSCRQRGPTQKMYAIVSLAPSSHCDLVLLEMLPWLSSTELQPSTGYYIFVGYSSLLLVK